MPDVQLAEQIKAEAGAAKQQPKAKASDGLVPWQEMRGKVSPVNQHRGCALVALKPLDKNVRVIIVSGMSGSGYEGCLHRAQSMLRSCGVATVCLNTNFFPGFNARACSICKRAVPVHALLRSSHLSSLHS